MYITTQVLVGVLEADLAGVLARSTEVLLVCALSARHLNRLAVEDGALPATNASGNNERIVIAVHKVELARSELGKLLRGATSLVPVNCKHQSKQRLSLTNKIASGKLREQALRRLVVGHELIDEIQSGVALRSRRDRDTERRHCKEGGGNAH